MKDAAREREAEYLQGIVHAAAGIGQAVNKVNAVTPTKVSNQAKPSVTS